MNGIHFQAIITDSLTYQKGLKLCMEINEGCENQTVWLLRKHFDEVVAAFVFKFEDGEIPLEARVMRVKSTKDFGTEVALLYEKNQLETYPLFDSRKGKLVDVFAFIPAVYKYGGKEVHADKRHHSEEHPTLKSSVNHT
jgi:hypothetical protein